MKTIPPKKKNQKQNYLFRNQIGLERVAQTGLLRRKISPIEPPKRKTSLEDLYHHSRPRAE